MKRGKAPGKTKPQKALPENWRAVQEWTTRFNEEMLFADGFEDAFMGVAERCSCPPLAVYDADKCIEILVARDGMTYDQAEEFFSFNTLGAWVGEHTPLFLWRPPKN